jgi:membrane associated rhomboid family serine protease
LATFTGLIWITSIFEIYFYRGYIIPALIPRTMDGLWGILTMPLVHGSMKHLICNTVPLLVFGWLILNRGVDYFIKTTTVVLLLGGLLVWIFAREAAHIGASGLVFGYFGFLVARGFYDKSIRSVVITLAIIFFYGGIIWGVLPTARFISWEAHLFGLIAGVIAARHLRHKTNEILI